MILISRPCYYREGIGQVALLAMSSSGTGLDSTGATPTVGDAARAGRTIVSTRCASTVPGSVHKPVCTGEVWMLVLRGATSQWKRSRGDS